MTTTTAKMGRMWLFALAVAGGAGGTAKAQEHRSEAAKPASDKAAPTDLYGDPLPSGAIARLGTVRFRHGDEFAGVFFSSDGRSLISVGNRAVRIWDTKSGRQQRQIDLKHPYNRVFGIDLSPDGKLLAVPFFGNPMRFWDLTSGAEVHPFGDDAPDVRRVAFSPGGEFLATHHVGNPITISIWDIRKGKKIQTIQGGEGVTSTIRSLAFSPRGVMLAFPCESGVCVWDFTAGKELHRLQSSTKTPLGCVVFSADGKLLAAASSPYFNQVSKDYAIHLWDLATGKEVAALRGHEDSLWALAMPPKSNLLVSASRDATIRFWDLHKRQEIGCSPGPARRFIALAFSADGSVLASGEVNGVLRLWDAHKHEEIAIPAAGSNSVQWVRFAPDGQTVISTVLEQIGIWEPLTGRPRHLLISKDMFGYNPDLSADGNFLAARSFRNLGRDAMLWNVTSGKMVRKLEGFGQPQASSLTFAPDGRRVAGASLQQGIIGVWDASNGKQVQQLKGHNKSYSVAFSPDGATLASASLDSRDSGDLTVRLWKLATSEEIWRKETRPWTAFALKFAPDDRTLALVGGMFGRANIAGEVRLWEAATGKELRRFEGHCDHVRCVDFSADGRMLTTGSVDKTVRLWEVASGGERQCFQGHERLIMSVSFSPDGQLLASSSADATALIWDLTGRFREGRFQPRRLSAEERNRCWDDLAHADSARAYRSILALTGSPKETIALLKDRLTPVRAADPKRAAPLLAALNSAQFAEREKAMSELEKMGLAVEPVLHAALNDKPSLELRRRIEAVLEKLSGGPRLRFLRALEVLEHIATAEARQVVESLSHGTAEMWPAQEAKASLKRLAAIKK